MALQTSGRGGCSGQLACWHQTCLYEGGGGQPGCFGRYLLFPYCFALFVHYLMCRYYLKGKFLDIGSKIKQRIDRYNFQFCNVSIFLHFGMTSFDPGCKKSKSIV